MASHSRHFRGGCFVLAQASHHHDKLITTVTRNGINLPHTTPHSLGCLREQQVACRMSMFVIG